jgi:hypothetical protein
MTVQYQSTNLQQASVLHGSCSRIYWGNFWSKNIMCISYWLFNHSSSNACQMLKSVICVLPAVPTSRTTSLQQYWTGSQDTCFTNHNSSCTTHTWASQLLPRTILLARVWNCVWALECVPQIALFPYLELRQLVFTYHTNMYIQISHITLNYTVRYDKNGIVRKHVHFQDPCR